MFFFSFLLVHSFMAWNKKHPQLFLFHQHASPWTHNSTMFLRCVFALHLHYTSYHEPPSPFHFIPIIINQTTFYAMLTPLPKYTHQISLTEKMQASKPFSEPYKHHISTKTPLTNTQEQNYVYPDFLSCIDICKSEVKSLSGPLIQKKIYFCFVIICILFLFFGKNKYF